MVSLPSLFLLFLFSARTCQPFDEQAVPFPLPFSQHHIKLRPLADLEGCRELKLAKIDWGLELVIFPLRNPDSATGDQTRNNQEAEDFLLN